MADTVNSQITDSVTQTNVKVVGEAPAQAMGLIYQTMAHSMSLSMQNAMQAQAQLQSINLAVTSSACRMILDASNGGVKAP